jgi:two-component system sensor histidine kinase YesM
MSLIGRFIRKMNDFSVKKKLTILYLFCMLLPLITTDSVILQNLIQAQKERESHNMENIAGSVRYSLASAGQGIVSIAMNIYTNQSLDAFLDQRYYSPLQYYDDYVEQLPFFKNSSGFSTSVVTIYTSNNSISSGGRFEKLQEVQDEKWYTDFIASQKDSLMYCYFDQENSPAVAAKRRMLFLRKLDFFKHSAYRKILRIELNYTSLVQDMLERHYNAPVYVCQDNKIIFSNTGHSDVARDFDTFTMFDQVGFTETFQFYGMDLQIYILKNKETDVLSGLRNNLPMVALLICVNLLLPWIFVHIFARTFTRRLISLSQAFDSVQSEKLVKITDVHGKDEIGSLMSNYNRMADRQDELIQRLFRETLKQQEIDIARQNAELLALHSQINPHFLFNALESIRMHSILRGETQTAAMVEKLAQIQRQYVEWGDDMVTIETEGSLTESYMELQKYRFGDHLSYRIEIQKDCAKYLIPKLTLLTFVENACVHGLESKSSSVWIFVRVYQEKESMVLEIEDTGKGMKEPVLKELRKKIAHASMEDLKQKGRVGIVNACMRLRMVTDEKVSINIESEEGAGTMVIIRLPLQQIISS